MRPAALVLALFKVALASWGRGTLAVPVEKGASMCCMSRHLASSLRSEGTQAAATGAAVGAAYLVVDAKQDSLVSTYECACAQRLSNFTSTSNVYSPLQEHSTEEQEHYTEGTGRHQRYQWHTRFVMHVLDAPSRQVQLAV